MTTTQSTSGFYRARPLDDRAVLRGVGALLVGPALALSLITVAASTPAFATEAAVLRPVKDVTRQWTGTAGSAAAALDDPVVEPTRVSAQDYIYGSLAGRVTEVAIEDRDLQGGTAQSTAWYYSNTGKATNLRVEALSGSSTIASATVSADSAFAWRSLELPTLDQQALNDLRLRFTVLDGGNSNVRAAYVNANVTPRPPAPSGQATPSPSQSGSTPSPGTSGAVREALNNYIAGLPALQSGPEGEEQINPVITTVSEPLPDPSTHTKQRRYQCTATPYKLIKNPDKIVAINPDANKLWLGALLQGAGYSGGLGSLRELPVRQRSPLNIYMDLLGDGVTKRVDSPSPSGVQQAISDLVQNAKDKGTVIPARLTFEQTDSSTSTESLLKLGFSAKYLGGEATAKLETQKSAQESSVSAAFIQRLYTVSSETPATPADYFSESFTMADLREHEQNGRIAVDNPPVVVSSISYGRVLLYTVTAKASKADLAAAVSAAYGGGAASASINVEAKYAEILNSARYQVVSIGGDEAAARNLIKERKLGEFFASRTDLSSAVPISYQVNNISNDSAARFSETTNYNLTECVPIPETATPVGHIVRMENFRGYVKGSCSQADIYGTLSVNGSIVWDVKQEKQHPARWTEFTFDGLRPPPVTPIDESYNQEVQPWEFALFTGGSIHISGSVQDRQTWARPSVNTYDWVMPYPTAFGEQEIDGGSPNCRILLRFTLSHKSNLYHWAP